MESQSRQHAHTNLKALRQHVKFSQTEMAFLISTSVSSYSSLEKGLGEFTPTVINSITKACGLSWQFFLAEPLVFDDESLGCATENLHARMMWHRELLAMDMSQVWAKEDKIEPAADSDLIVPELPDAQGVTMADLVKAGVLDDPEQESQELTITLTHKPRSIVLMKNGVRIELKNADHPLVSHALPYIAYE